MVFAVQFIAVAARATPLPKTNTTAIVVSSPIALFLIFISFRPFRLCRPLLARSPLACRDYESLGEKGAQHIYRMGHLWLATWHIFGVCQVANVLRRQRLGELLRTPSTRSSEKDPSTRLSE